MCGRKVLRATPLLLSVRESGGCCAVSDSLRPRPMSCASEPRIGAVHFVGFSWTLCDPCQRRRVEHKSHRMPLHTSFFISGENEGGRQLRRVASVSLACGGHARRLRGCSASLVQKTRGEARRLHTLLRTVRPRTFARATSAASTSAHHQRARSSPIDIAFCAH